jgi:hypothetical protein
VAAAAAVRGALVLHALVRLALAVLWGLAERRRPRVVGQVRLLREALRRVA